MEITRDVILDLLPLYLAGEASEDTRLLVEEYLGNDPKLADVASQPMTIEIADDISVSLNEEEKMDAYKEAKRLMFWRTIIVAIVISAVIFALLTFAAVAWLFLTSA